MTGRGTLRGAGACGAIVLLLAHVADAGAGVRGRSLADAPRATAPSQRIESATDSRLVGLTERLSARVAALRAAASDTRTAPQPAALAALRRDAGEDVQVWMRPQLGTPMLIRGASLQPSVATSGTTAAEGDEQTARAFFQRIRPLLRLADPAAELALRRVESDSQGRRHLRFAQRYGDLPVWPGEITVELGSAGAVNLMQGFSVATPRLSSLVPSVSPDAAVAAARAAVPDGATERTTAPELIIDALARSGPRLAWQLEVATAPDARWVVVVDAVTGRVLTAFNRVASENVTGSGVDIFGDTRPLNVFRDTDGTHYLTDTTKPMFDPTSQPPRWENTRGAIIVFDARNQPPTSNVSSAPDEVFYLTSPSPTVWEVPDGVSAAFNVSQAYDYYLDRHGRDSQNGQRGSIYAVVRLGQNYANAFWDGVQLNFGDAHPYAGVLDTVAHEFTHGVTGYTANLLYKDQSGALNEAMSDIFGEMVEARTFGAFDWLHGTGGNVTRSLSRPEDFDQPSRLSDFFVTDSDNGGVHTNSGIINHAFYLLADGFDDAIGLRDAERIFYRALAFQLVSNSQFIDARLACVAAAEALFGADSRQARVTADAFDAVEIFDGRVTPPPPNFPPVTGVDATLSLFYDDLAQAYFLARRETSIGDPADGAKLLDVQLSAARPSVSGDGAFAVFVDANHDVCFVNTDGTPIDPEGDSVEECLGFDFISSVAVAPDGERFGFVLLDEAGDPDNRIRIIDLGAGGETRTFVLRAPAQDGGEIDTILYASTLEFSADGELVVYDALNSIPLAGGGEALNWSIYALDLRNEETIGLVPPIPGLDIAFPALSQTSDNFLTFDAYDEGRDASTVMTMNLTTGATAEIATVDGAYGAPGYAGDDTAVIYSQVDDVPTGFSLRRQPLADDRLTPSGPSTEWLHDADYGVIYRRGAFTGPPPTPTATEPLPTATATATLTPTGSPGASCAGDCNQNGTVGIDELIRSVSIALGAATLDQCPRADVNRNGQVQIDDLIAAVNAALSGC